MNVGPTYISVTEASEVLGITPQAVRNRLRKQRLSGLMGVRPWRVDASDVARVAVESGRSFPEPSNEDRRVSELERELWGLQTLHTEVEAQRDHYRAEAAAAKEAALAISGAAANLVDVTKRLALVAEEQIGAVVQLLAPGSPADLPPGESSQQTD